MTDWEALARQLGYVLEDLAAADAWGWRAQDMAAFAKWRLSVYRDAIKEEP